MVWTAQGTDTPPPPDRSAPNGGTRFPDPEELRCVRGWEPERVPMPQAKADGGSASHPSTPGAAQAGAVALPPPPQQTPHTRGCYLEAWGCGPHALEMGEDPS